MILTLLLMAAAPTLADCQRDTRYCPAYEDQKKLDDAAEETKRGQERAEREAARVAALEAQSAELAAEDQAEEARKTHCGKDYGRVRVGMKFSRVRECAGEFELKYEDGKAKVYEAAGGMVRVESGRVTRVLYRR